MKSFFEKTFSELKDEKKLLTAVITDVKGEKLAESLIGEMILFDQQGVIEFSSEKMAADLEEYFAEAEIKEKLLTDSSKKSIDSELKEISLDAENKLEIFLEPVVDKPQLKVFGAGHIAKQLVKICSLMDFNITVIDDREEFLNHDNFPTADHLVVMPYSEYFDKYKVKENDYLVTVTRGHQYDYDVLKNVIHSEADYIGMIGSSRKNKTVFAQLKEDGISEEKLAEVHAPIGLAIGSETPAEIAVAIAAEIIAVRRDK